MSDNNSAPFEIVAAPYTVWYSELGVAFPDVDEVPGVGWNLVGSSGDLNYDDGAGVTVAHQQSIQKWRAAGDCGVRKAFRTEEDQMVKLVLVDMTLEQYAHALNLNTVASTPAALGTPGSKKIGLSRGFSIKTVQLLVRGPSSEMADGAAQYEIPRCMQTGTPEVVFKKGTPAGLALEWTALVDPDAATDDERFGRLLVQTAAALT